MKHGLLLLVIICSGFNSQSQVVIQFDISGLLNARPVTTLTKGRLITWSKGIDGGGRADGYLTQSAARFNGDTNAHAVPDNPLIAANAKHPKILLHYNNNDSLHNQAKSVSGEDEFIIKVPHRHYSQAYLGFSSAEGSSDLQCELVYSNSREVKHYMLPDYYNNIAATDSCFTYIVTDLAKWGPHNNMTEKDHHNIHLLTINTDKSKILTAIRIRKSKKGYLVFWSATGRIIAQ